MKISEEQLKKLDKEMYKWMIEGMKEIEKEHQREIEEMIKQGKKMKITLFNLIEEEELK